jgi:hypothetical protein
MVRATPVEDDEEEEEDIQATMQFSQIETEEYVAPKKCNDSEEYYFAELNEAVQEKAIKTLSRLILLKALAGECIVKSKCLEESGIDWEGHGNKKRAITNVAFSRAEERVEETFAFKVAAVPPDMIEALPSKFKDRYYVFNVLEDADGTQSKKLHFSVGCKERGVLMAILSFAFCKGTMRQAPGERIEGIRWISDQALYHLLNHADERISDTPPDPKSSSTTGNQRRTDFTREVDTMIDRFAQMDYLLKEKGNPDGPTPANEQGFSYAMGPRSVLEIGRKQLLYFTAEVLDEEPDPTMLAVL